jgi:hypothetical protein
VNLHRGEDVGVNLVLNAHHPILHCPPITFAPTLLDGTGGLPATPEELWEHGDLDEVRREVRAQIERSISWGFDISHLASHLDVLVKRPEFFDILIDSALEFAVPLSFSASLNESTVGFPASQRAREEGIPTPDTTLDLHLLNLDHRKSGDLESWLDANLQVGLTEITVTPGLDSPELRDLFDDWEYFASDYSLLTDPGTLITSLRALGISLYTYRQFRDQARRTGALSQRKVGTLR